MSLIQKFLIAFALIAVSVLMIWVLAIPKELIIAYAEEALSDIQRPKISFTTDRLKKGIFFSVHADNIVLEIDGRPALKITDITVRINPFSFILREIGFSLTGRLGAGSLNGSFTLPGGGYLTVIDADLHSIPFLKRLGANFSGYTSAVIDLDDTGAELKFEIPDLKIQGTEEIALPLIISFHTVQGVLKITEDIIQITSIGIDGEKGYARIKGNITGGGMNLALELMPDVSELSSTEMLLIGRYQKSPGFYVIPITGQLF